MCTGKQPKLVFLPTTVLDGVAEIRSAEDDGVQVSKSLPDQKSYFPLTAEFYPYSLVWQPDPSVARNFVHIRKNDAGGYVLKSHHSELKRGEIEL